MKVTSSSKAASLETRTSSTNALESHPRWLKRHTASENFTDTASLRVALGLVFFFWSTRGTGRQRRWISWLHPAKSSDPRKHAFRQLLAMHQRCERPCTSAQLMNQKFMSSLSRTRFLVVLGRHILFVLVAVQHWRERLSVWYVVAVCRDPSFDGL